MPQTVAKGATPWKIGLALLIGAFLAAMTATLFTAASGANRVVDADYYNHGLHYGETQDRSKNPGAGWSISAGLSGSELLVRVRDEAGAPVAGGVLRFEPLRAGAGQPEARLALVESAPGVFRAQSPGASRGELRGTLRFTRGAAVACQKLVLFL